VLIDVKPPRCEWHSEVGNANHTGYRYSSSNPAQCSSACTGSNNSTNTIDSDDVCCDFRYCIQHVHTAQCTPYCPCSMLYRCMPYVPCRTMYAVCRMPYAVRCMPYDAFMLYAARSTPCCMLWRLRVPHVPSSHALCGSILTKHSLHKAPRKNTVQHITGTSLHIHCRALHCKHCHQHGYQPQALKTSTKHQPSARKLTAPFSPVQSSPAQHSIS
jgi:hypothetical protein